MRNAGLEEAQTGIKFDRKNINSFRYAEEVAKILTCSRATAYRTIDKLNRELDKKGYLTFSGKISKKYFEERLYI